MATGLDAVGLALAMLPMVVQLLGTYSGRVKNEELAFLNLSLRNTERIYKNAVEDLLKEIISSAEIRQLLEDPEGARWHDSNLSARLADHLGGHSEEMFETARQIAETMKKLKENLPKLEITSSESGIKRGRKVIKQFVRGPKEKASLERCKILTKEFQELCTGGQRLAPSRRIVEAMNRPLPKLRLHQKHASALHDAIRDGWRCSHDHSHVANLRLEMWNTTSATSALDSPQFKFLFSLAPTSSSDAGPTNWQYADIRLLPAGTGSTAGPTTNLHTGEVVVDLCRFLEQIESGVDTAGACLGVLIDKRLQFGIFRNSEQEPLGSGAMTMQLSHLHDLLTKDATPLVLSDQMQLALTLGWNVLQLQNTHWLEEYWTSEHIRLVANSTNDMRPYVTHHFQSMRRERGGPIGSELSLTPSQREQIDDFIDVYVPNKGLFNLGIMLIELCHGQPIQRLAERKDRGSVVLTALRLAKHLEGQVGGTYEAVVRSCLFCNFGGAGSRAELTDEQFQEGIYDHIVQPLRKVAMMTAATA